MTLQGSCPRRYLGVGVDSDVRSIFVLPTGGTDGDSGCETLGVKRWF